MAAVAPAVEQEERTAAKAEEVTTIAQEEEPDCTARRTSVENSTNSRRARKLGRGAGPLQLQNPHIEETLSKWRSFLFSGHLCFCFREEGEMLSRQSVDSDQEGKGILD